MWYVADLKLHYKLSQRGLNVSYNNNAVMMLGEKIISLNNFVVSKVYLFLTGIIF